MEWIDGCGGCCWTLDFAIANNKRVEANRTVRRVKKKEEPLDRVKLEFDGEGEKERVRVCRFQLSWNSIVGNVNI